MPTKPPICIIIFVSLIFTSTASRETLELGKICKNGNLKNPLKPISVNCPNISIPLPPVSSLPIPTQLLQFVDKRLELVYPVIQNFKSIITSDPLGITKTWNGSDICSYKGFFCDNPPNNLSAITVASIDFNGFQLSAPTIDGFIDKFPDLALFHANSNFFSGSISPKIANLQYLYELDISNNRFSGPFPSAILAMPGLTFLDIRFNFFTGAVPPQLFADQFDALFLNNNNFITTLPATIGTTHLVYLTLANNRIIGPIPGAIFKAFSSLSEVLLLNNQLTGCLPYEIGLLKEAVVFDIGNNQLTGPLPVALGCLEKAEQLNFAGNFLYGMVPEIVCKLEKLVNLSLSDNYFTAVGPICREMMEKGVVDLRNNCIGGLPLQRSVVECAKFFAHPKICPNVWSHHAYIPCIPPFASSASAISPP